MIAGKETTNEHIPEPSRYKQVTRRLLLHKEAVGIILAVLATIVWSGNFIVARGVAKHITPISLAFFRWSTATVILAPFALKQLLSQRKIIFQNIGYFALISLIGVTLYNTFIYIAGHYSPAINLAIIGTTSSPVFAIILAAIILKEKITVLRIVGLCTCIFGILFLISEGSWQKLAAFQFSKGDVWILIAAVAFAIYNVLVRKKPEGISPVAFLFTTFLLGTILLIPLYIKDSSQAPPINWDTNLLLVILYIGAGASVTAYLLWNQAIARLGAARTALFGNLIPVFSIIEAVIILNEKFTVTHIISSVIVIIGLVIANLRRE